MTAQEFKSNYPILPEAPGVYKFYNEKKKLLYVGKAKNLKKRISSYFGKKHDNEKTSRLVQEIFSIDYQIVNSEHDALLLENNFIKTHRPPFNINLKDDKTYPYIIIRNEDFPRVYLTRRPKHDGSLIFGPYTSVSSAYAILDFIQEHIPLRNCSLDLSSKQIKKNKYKACLQYHIKKCNAPCVKLQSQENYQEEIDFIKHILSGKTQEVIQFYKNKMSEFVEQLAFEKAQDCKAKIEAFHNFQNKSIISTNTDTNADILVYKKLDTTLYFTYFIVENGMLVRSHQQAIVNSMDESDEEIFLHAFLLFHTSFQSKSKELWTSYDFQLSELNGVQIQRPQIGAKRKLVDLALENNLLYIEKIQQEQDIKQEHVKSKMDILENIQRELCLKLLPSHIECFDNSNIQGNSPVAAMVCFINGLPSKKNYRRFHIKTVEGINDFASMEEIVYRRYKRILDENQELPKLVIIDGGKGQLSAAMKSIHKLNIADKMDVIGLAKKHEEIFLPMKSKSIKLEWNSAELHLIRVIRDEVHRFAITFHRKTRGKAAIRSPLDNIKGIGEKTKEQFYKHFKSVKSMSDEDFDRLKKLIGDQKAKLIYNYFFNKK